MVGTEKTERRERERERERERISLSCLLSQGQVYCNFYSHPPRIGLNLAVIHITYTNPSIQSCLLADFKMDEGSNGVDSHCSFHLARSGSALLELDHPVAVAL